MSHIVVAGTITLVLVFLFRYVQINWPESYFGPAESLARFVSRGAGRYALFRFGPPFLLFALVSAYAPDSLSATVGLYVAVSTGLSICGALRGAESSPRLTRPRIAALMVIALGLAAVGVLAALVGPHIAPHLPGVEDVIVELVAAVIAAALTAGFIFGTRNGDGHGAHAEISDDLSYAFRMAALDVGADDRLAAAIALAEEVQRPYWFRRVERKLWRLNKNGSFGLYQVSGMGPLTTSIRVA